MVHEKEGKKPYRAGDPCPGNGGRMKALVMTADELRAYIRCLPEQVILRVIIQEVRDGTEENEEV